MRQLIRRHFGDVAIEIAIQVPVLRTLATGELALLQSAIEAALELGGIESVDGRGEMAAPSLAQARERWVEGSKPKAGVETGPRPVKQQ